MSLVVEDGTIVAGAESYLSVADADTYWGKHGSPTAWTGATTANKESALRYATQWIDDKFTWSGWIVESDQPLNWPRQGVWDDQNRPIDADEIPVNLKDATAEMAKNHIDAAVNASLARGGDVKREKVDVIEVEYMDAANSQTVYPYIQRMLIGYTASGEIGTVPILRVA